MGVITTIEQNGWGRKTKLTDPSAGEYNYTYNDLGEILTESSPNGTTTYTLNAEGKLIQKTIVGANTNSSTTYTYDSSTKLLTSSTFVDNFENNATITNVYTYDSNKKLASHVETTPYAIFSKEMSYDAFGRLDTETSIANAAGKSSVKTVQHTYKNGRPWQIIDTSDSQILWQTNTVNARGQLVTAQNGPTTITNSYDTYGLPSEFKYDKTSDSSNILTLNTLFDANKGNLTSRTNNLFNWNESFEYDAQDRLTKFANSQGLPVTQTYDDKGRILQNSLGTYTYNATKPYQNNSIAITPEAVAYYDNREGIYNDSMEEKGGWGSSRHPGTVFYSYDDTNPHNGNTSLKLTNTTETEQYVHSDTYINIDNAQDREYTYSVWVRGDSPEAELVLFMYNSGEQGYFSFVDAKTTALTDQWTKVEKTFMVPASVKKLNIRLDNNGTGNVWFDDVKIRKTNNAVVAERELNATYNVFKSPLTLEETGVDKISFEYNENNDRTAMFYGGLNDHTDKLLRPYRKYYSGDGTMEIKQNMLTGGIEFVTYIGGDGYTAPMVFKSDGATNENYLYLQRDYQGSIVAIADQSGTIVEKRLFDAWGNIIKVQDGTGKTLAGLTILDRGYTGHEHLQSIGIIHMNGRLYDPKLHRFLQPDNYVQDPFNTQNYNRYGYVLNNPLKYTDPSGEKFTWSDLFAGVAIVAGVIVTGLSWGLAAPVGYGLIAAGVAHFGAAYAEYSNTGDWTSASNNAGISFSTTVTTDFGYDDSKNHIPGVIQNDPVVKPIAADDVRNMTNAKMYYDALDGIQFNNGSIKHRSDFVLTFKPSEVANATYLGFKGGKYHINFDIADFEVTKSNIRALTIHEAYGHGDMNYGDDNKNHYKAYTATIDSKYWQTTTYEFKHNTVYKMWYYFYNEVGNKIMQEKYMNEYDKYIKRR